MDDRPAAPAEAALRQPEPQAPLPEEALTALAECHAALLPGTASTAAGTGALRELYRILSSDPRSRVLWIAPGAFASATVDLDATEARIRRSLPFRHLLLLAAHTLRSPGHLLAQASFKRHLPPPPSGYILTVGVSENARTSAPAIRGAALIEQLEGWFRERGASESWVDTEERNEAAIGMYSRLGYEIAAKRFGHVLLRKRLAITPPTPLLS